MLKRIARLCTFSRLLILALLLPACLRQTSLATPTATTPSNQASPNLTLNIPQPDTPTPLPRLTASPLPFFTATPGISQPDNPFPLTLPVSIALTAPIPIDPSYRFASTQNGNREPHHGVEFLLPFGSPVLAAAEGTVLFAGNDNNGSPYSPPNNYAFYGNFIIVEHLISPLPLEGEETGMRVGNGKRYTLYAHLSEILVQTGDTVLAGDEIGLIGFSGAALGPHLHFEVRLDGLTYADSYNPELFLDQPGQGILVGAILDARVAGNPGHPIPPTALTLTPLNPAGRSIYLTTYEDPALALRPPFRENFALALSPGKYEVGFVLYGIHTQTIEIKPGEFTFFEMTAGNE